MADEFNAYHVWLGIPPQEQPANHYRLLGIGLFEDNPAVIESAADRQMAHLRSVQVGKHQQLSQRLLNEISSVRVCLLNREKKAAYDGQLRASLQNGSRPRQSNSSQPATAQPTASVATPTAKPLARAMPMAQAAPLSSDEEWSELLGEVDRKPAIRAASSRSSGTVSKSAATKSRRALDRKTKMIASGGAAIATLLAAIAITRLLQPSDGAFALMWPIQDRGGAELTIDGVPTAIPSNEEADFACAAGEHRIVIHRPSYQPFETTISIGAAQRLRIVPTWKVKSSVELFWPVEERQDSQMTIDGKTRTVSEEQPIEIPFEPGEHAIDIIRPESQPFHVTFSLAANDRRPIRVRTPQTAVLAIHWPLEERSGALISIDGRGLNPGPNADWELSIPLGQHTIRIARPGFRTFNQTMSMDKGSRRAVIPIWVADRPTGSALPPTRPTSRSTADSTNDSTAAPRAAADGNNRKSKKHPVPGKTEQQRIISDVGELDAETGDKLSRAKELYQLAEKSQRPDEQYVLWHEGGRLASQAAEMELAMEGVEALAADFEIDAIEVKRELIETALDSAASAEQLPKVIEAAEQLIDEMIAADRYEAAQHLIVLVTKAATKKTATAQLYRETDEAMTRRRQEIRVLQPMLDAIVAAQTTLESKPDDPALNLKVGTWDCFDKRDWQHGLPLLAKGNDESLKALAERELAWPSNPVAQYELADSWWKVAQKESGLGRDNVRLHAAAWYEMAQPQLSSSVKKAVIDRRLGEIAALRRSAGRMTPLRPTHVEFPLNQWVDLMPLIDVKRDSASGHWTRKEADIRSRVEAAAALALPVVVDGEFDLELNFTPATGTGQVDLFLPFGQQQACFIVSSGDGIGGFAQAPGASGASGKISNARLPSLDDGKPHQLALELRFSPPNVGLMKFNFDGNIPGTLRHDDLKYPFVRDPWTLPDIRQPGVGVQGAQVTIHGARIKMISGKGRFAPSAPTNDPKRDRD